MAAQENVFILSFPLLSGVKQDKKQLINFSIFKKWQLGSAELKKEPKMMEGGRKLFGMWRSFIFTLIYLSGQAN